MSLVPMFKQQLNEGDAVVLRMYSLGQIQPAYRVVPNHLKLNFITKTQISQCVDFKGSVHGFVFKPFKEILQSQTKVIDQFGGTELNCMLWGDNADKFLKSCDDVGRLIVVIELGKMKKWDGAILLLRPDNEQLANTASKISKAAKCSTHDEFLTKYPFRNIDELLELPKAEVSVIVAIVILIQEEEGWWYLGCRKCNKKVVRVVEVRDPEDKDTSSSDKGSNGFFCKTCNVLCSNVVTRFRMQCRVQDETGTASLVLCEKFVGWSFCISTFGHLKKGNHIRPSPIRKCFYIKLIQCFYMQNGKLDEFPSDFNQIPDRKYAFKINMDDWQSMKELPSWTV
ncbi:replication protein A 70 kDa DNA-binding subunit B [Tanacetum coccineum]